jgi:4-hydroxy-tetrahydrodipicolinate synthase
MGQYTKDEARDWARNELKGVCNVIIPSYTADLRRLNEEGIRHDVLRDIALGFRGALIVSETAITPAEYIQMVEWASDEAKGSLMLFFHASFNTLEENIELANRAAAAGAEVALLSYLFPVPLWGFERLHPASIPIDMLEEMVDTIPNVAAIKAEGGMPAIAGFTEAWNRLSGRVVITMPLEQQAIPLATILPLQLIATSNTECLGSAVPQMLDLCRAGKYSDAMEIYWRVDPARRANERIGIAGSNTVHRMAWKYQAWLTGFNGGPMRMPTQRLVQSQMAAYRAAAREAGVLTASEPDELFFAGRNPQ